MDLLAKDLSSLVGMRGVSVDPADRDAYAHDFWPKHLIAARADAPRPRGPRAIVWPENQEQLAAVLQYAQRLGIRVTPFGAASGVLGGLCLDGDVLAVDLKRMRTLHSVDKERGVAEADAGILGQHLEDQLQRKGVTLGHFPSSIFCSTLGGWAATRSAGQCSGRYGKIEDMVLSMEGVLPTGELFRVGAPAPGSIDHRALLVGSESLFGFLTRATVRVWPAPVRRHCLAFTFREFAVAWEAMRMVYGTGLRPAVSRLYDPFDTYIFRTGARRSHDEGKKAPGAQNPLMEFLLRRALSAPQWMNALNDTVGDRVFGASLLLLLFEEAPGENGAEQAEHARKIATKLGGEDQGEAYGKRWLERRHAVSYRLPPTYAKGLWADTFEVAAPWSRLGALYEGVRAALGTGGFVMAHMSHAYPDGCSIYFTFAGGSPDDEEALRVYTATWQKALQAAHEAGGTISHHHGIGRSKRVAMRLEHGAGIDVMEVLARAADPHGVMLRGPLLPDPGEGPTVPRGTLPRFAPTEQFVLDEPSRLANVPVSMTMAALREKLTRSGFSLRTLQGEGTVREALQASAAPAVLRDPVDHEVAGFSATLSSGDRVWLQPAPRRAAGPELFTLFAHGQGRFGTLDTVSLRVHGNDETAPQWCAPVQPSAVESSASLTAWIDRAAEKMR